MENNKQKSKVANNKNFKKTNDKGTTDGNDKKRKFDNAKLNTNNNNYNNNFNNNNTDNKFKKRKGDEATKQAKKLLDQFLQVAPKKRKTKLDILQKVIELVEGRMSKQALKPDMSRVIQTLLKYGNENQRSLIYKELKDDLKQLSYNIYGHKLVVKVLKYYISREKDFTTRLELYKEIFFGNMKDFISSRFSGEVLDYCYVRLWNSEERRYFTQEFYGSSFLWNKENSSDSLKDSLDKNTEGAIPVITKNLNTIVSGAIKKECYELALVQKLIIDLFQCAEPDVVRFLAFDLCECGAIPRILHTSTGCRISLYCIAYGGAKERKMIIKSLGRARQDAGNVEQLEEGVNATEINNELLNDDPHNNLAVLAAENSFGSVVISYLFKVIDDTVLMNAKILKHFRKILSELLVHQHGVKPILYILSGSSKFLNIKEAITMFDELDLRTEVLHDGVLTKKGSDKIREEILLSFGPSIATAITENFETLISDPHGHLVVREAVLQYPTNKDFEKVANALKSLLEKGKFDPSNKNISSTLSSAILNSKEGGFSDMAYEVVKGKCSKYIIEKNLSFVISALLKTSHGLSVYNEIKDLQILKGETTDKNIIFLQKVFKTKAEEFKGK
ncbi:hypothetical protein ABK040_000126 [Willaertia magna]